jgi:hypothetical protein
MFDYDVNIRKIHEICNKIYTKRQSWAYGMK